MLHTFPLRALPFLTVFLAVCSTGRAQDGPTTALRVFFNGMPPEEVEKALYENLRGIDESCTIVLDHAHAQMDILSRSSLPSSAFSEILGSVAGTRISSIQDLSVPTAMPTGIEGIPGAPRYVETGNEVADDLRYQEAKRAWIAADPDVYRALHETTKKTD